MLVDNARVVKWAGPAFALFSLILLPWTVYLAYSLPSRQVSADYGVAWAGFDVILLAALAGTGYFALRRSRYLATAATASAGTRTSRRPAPRVTRKPARGSGHLPVDLPWPGAAGLDGQLTAGQVGHPAGPVPQQHVGGEPQPPRPSRGGQHRHVENAVIGCGVRQQPDVALQRADVADDHAAGPAALRRAAVRPQRHPDRSIAQMPQRGQHVGGPAHPALQPLVRIVEHLGVEPDPRHHHERLAVGGADVQPPVGSGQRLIQ